MIEKKNFRFTNWAKNITSNPQSYFIAESEADIVSLLLRCEKENRKLRLIGSGHSWSAVCSTDEYLLSLDKYAQVINLDFSQNTITVQAGIKIFEINTYLYNQGYSLSNLGSISKQSIAGAISTATHGSSIQHQILAQQVIRFKLIQPNGKICCIDKNHNEQLFYNSLISIGTLGIISEITLQIVPRFHLEEIAEWVDFDEVCQNILQWVKKTEFIKLWWFPHTDKIMVYRYFPTKKPLHSFQFFRWIFEEILSTYFFSLMLIVGNQFRSWRAPINRLIVNYLMKPLYRVGKSHDVFNVPMPPKHRETEWAFDLQRSPEILQAYRNMIKEKNHQINFVQEIRFVKADNFALSPCYQRDSIYIGAYHACSRDWSQIYNDFHDWAKFYDGRPHWGKEMKVDADYLHQQYPLLHEFKSLRKKIDPNDMLLNEFTMSIFK